MEITIHGFTSRQRLLADLMWAMNSQQQVQQFMQTLPAEFRVEAESVHQTMIAAVLDQVTETDMAEKVLSKYHRPR